jgi:hypothetical protein
MDIIAKTTVLPGPPKKGVQTWVDCINTQEQSHTKTSPRDKTASAFAGVCVIVYIVK